MDAKYEVHITAACPVDRKPDSYQLVVESSRPVPVEKLLMVCEQASAMTAFQEEVTAYIARALSVKATTVGYHSGVKVTCTCR